MLMTCRHDRFARVCAASLHHGQSHRRRWWWSQLITASTAPLRSFGSPVTNLNKRVRVTGTLSAAFHDHPSRSGLDSDRSSFCPGDRIATMTDVGVVVTGITSGHRDRRSRPCSPHGYDAIREFLLPQHRSYSRHGQFLQSHQRWRHRERRSC